MSCCRRHRWTLQAETQHSLVTHAQLSVAGYSRNEISSMVRNRELIRVQPRVFRVAGAQVTWRSRFVAPTLATGAVVSHTAAATLLGLQRVADRSTPHVVVRGTARPRLWRVIAHRTSSLDARDVTEVDGIPVTSGARTLVDLAGVLDRSTLTALLDDAICARVVSRAWMHQRARDLLNGRRGVAQLLRLTGPGAEGEFRSWLERKAAVVFRHGGLPAPEWNVPIRREGRLIAVVDAYWRAANLAVELDGLAFHSNPRHRQRDVARDRQLTAVGCPPLRFTWYEIVEEPHKVVREIREALALRQGLSRSAG